MNPNRTDESDPDRHIDPPSAAPGPPAEQAALTPSLPIAEVRAEQEGPWGRFLSALLGALSAWAT
jgi:hypothetical protein